MSDRGDRPGSDPEGVGGSDTGAGAGNLGGTGSGDLGGTGSGAGSGGLGSGGDPGGTGDLGGAPGPGSEPGNLEGVETKAGNPTGVRDDPADLQRSGPKPDIASSP
jgi:hypothetical protein